MNLKFQVDENHRVSKGINFNQQVVNLSTIQKKLNISQNHFYSMTTGKGNIGYNFSKMTIRYYP